MFVKEMRSRGEEVYHFGFGQSPFPVPNPMVEELKKHAHEKDYLPVGGLPALKEAIAKYHTERDGIETSADQILIAPGSKELLFTLQMQLTENIWYMNAPSWVSYGNQAQVLQANNEKFMKTDFEKKWWPDMKNNKLDKGGFMILNYPNNPTGLSLGEEEIKQYAKWIEENDCFVLADEIYSSTQFEGQFHSIRKFIPDRTFVTSGISKWCGAGGWRLGYLIIPKAHSYLKEVLETVVSETYSCVSSPIQYASVVAYQKNTEIDDYVKRMKNVLKAVGLFSYEVLKEGNVKVHKPSGGFYLYVDFENFRDQLAKNGVTDSKSMCDHLLKKNHVALLAGKHFHEEDSCLRARLSYVDFDGTEAIENVETFDVDNQEARKEFVKKWAPRVYKGIHEIVNWTKSL